MKNVTFKSVEKLIKNNNINGSISMNIENNIYTINSSNGGSVSFESLRIADKVFRFLKFEFGFSYYRDVMSQDEFDGMCQSSQLGVNPFECTILG